MWAQSNPYILTFNDKCYLWQCIILHKLHKTTVLTSKDQSQEGQNANILTLILLG